ncbi:MAG: prepilin peptidase [Oscillospiraceae bacterium]|nr:prepilin peptidase [Oscillospiraceae bacterium]
MTLIGIDWLETLIKIYALVFGLCFGSFANVVIYRIPRGESIVSPPSRCPQCGKRLTLLDMIPALSWLFLRGRCRHCKTRVSCRYPIVEIMCAALWLGNIFFTGIGWQILPLCVLAFVLLCIAWIDFDIQEIPDSLVIAGAAAGILWIISGIIFPDININAPVWHDALLGAVVGAAPLFLIDRLTMIAVKKEGFGFGDVKLMAMAGLFLGWQLTLVSLLFAVVSGGILGAVLIASKKIDRGGYMPFGPFLAMGIIASLWFGEKFIGVLL